MKKYIEISGNRIAAIDIKRIFDKEAIKEQTQKVSEEDMVKFTLNDKPWLVKFKIDTVEIICRNYDSTSYFLTGEDLALIEEAYYTLHDELRKEPFTLMDYYS